MLVLRIIGIFGALFLLGIGLAFAFTRERKYLRLGWRVIQGVLLLLVAFGLFYVFSRVLLL